MDFFDQLEKGRYGSFELKRQVGPNMIKGLLISLLLHSTVIASPFVIAKLFLKDAALPEPVVTTTVPWVDFHPKLKPMEPRPAAAVALRVTQPDLAKKVVPIPVKDPEDADPISKQVPDQHTIIDVKGDTTPDSGPTGPVVYTDPEPPEVIPERPSFTAVEIEPRPLSSNPQPGYPELAQITAKPGRVTVQVYVDKHGDVRKWVIAKADPKGLGFEEEVLKVISQWKFTPAIQAGKPIGVWVAVPFNFSVKR